MPVEQIDECKHCGADSLALDAIPLHERGFALWCRQCGAIHRLVGRVWEVRVPARLAVLEGELETARAEWKTQIIARRNAEAERDALPKRGDEDRHECTDTPIFLIQSRRFSVADMSMISWDSDRETLVNEDGEEVTRDHAGDLGLGTWEWDTQRVAFSRAEAQRWCDARPYRGPWRVYSVPSMGDLRTLLKARTDYDAATQEGSHMTKRNTTETSEGWRGRMIRETEGMTPGEMLAHLAEDTNKNGAPPAETQERGKTDGS